MMLLYVTSRQVMSCAEGSVFAEVRNFTCLQLFSNIVVIGHAC